MVPWGALSSVTGSQGVLVVAVCWLCYQYKAPDWFGRDTLWTGVKEELRQEVRASNDDLRRDIESVAESNDDIHGRIEAVRGDIESIADEVDDLHEHYDEHAQALRVVGYTLDPDEEFVVDASDLDEYLEDNGIDAVELVKRSADNHDESMRPFQPGDD